MRDDRRLDVAVSQGIISAEQAEAIRALDRPHAGPAESDGESPRAFNPATLAYVLGALTVLIAMGWFLSDRWNWLGAGGALGVALFYAAIFLLVAFRLKRLGFPQAAGFGTLLAVMMTPVAASAVLELTGWFAENSRSLCYGPDYAFWGCRGEEVVLELATAAAALFALRRVRFSLLVVPLIFIGLRAIFLASDAAWHGISDGTSGWIWMLGTSFLVAVAYVTERAQRGDEDFALWLQLGAAISTMSAAVMLVNSYGNFRHLLIPAAFVAFAFSLRMRRAPWLVLGMLWFVWYVYWLADDVFSNTPFFPIILAALGIGVIVATVWMQRNRTRLLARFGGKTSEQRTGAYQRPVPSFPGGVWLMLLPALLAAIQLPGAARLDRAMMADSQASTRAYQALSRRREKETNPRPTP